MTEYTSASTFSCGGGQDIGAMQAGFKVICANEYDPKIVAVYAQNIGNHIRVGDILDQDPHTWPDVDHLHASPPCPNFSIAKVGREETAHDIALSDKVAEFIRTLRPRWFTLENVRAYRESKSFAIIRKALDEGGYIYDAPILNAADYGVPQTRKRLYLRATRDGLLRPLPQAQRWIGWYEAIEDFVDSLPVTEFAKWQLDRLPENVTNHIVFSHSEITGTGRGEMTGRDARSPYPTVIAGDGHRPASMARGFIVDGQNTSGALTIRYNNEPEFTQTSSSHKGVGRAWLNSGRVVKMTPRALARFQSFPDWYKLPPKTDFACRIIGNAVPPRLAEVVLSSLLP